MRKDTPMADVESFTLDHTIVKAPYVRLIASEKGPHGGMGQGMTGQGMMGRGMMGRGMMGFADTRAMRIAFILMDADGDGSLSVEEFRAGHDRIFKGLDANKDGRLTMEEIGAFMRGSDTGRAPRP